MKTINSTIIHNCFFILLLFPTAFAHAADLAPQDISFTATHDQTPQKYVLTLPKDYSNQKPHNLLIALHGHGSDRWQFVKSPRDECRAVRDFAARRGMILVSPDYRAKTSWMGPAAEADLVQIIGDFKKQYKVRRVFLCGASMGGTGALTFAALQPQLIDGVASMNGTANLIEYERFQEAIRKSFGGTKVEVPLEYKKRSSEYWPEKFRMPLAIVVGDEDKVVPPESAVRLAGTVKALGNKNVLLLHGTVRGHATNYADATAVLEFVVGMKRGR